MKWILKTRLWNQPHAFSFIFFCVHFKCVIERPNQCSAHSYEPHLTYLFIQGWFKKGPWYPSTLSLCHQFACQYSTNINFKTRAISFICYDVNRMNLILIFESIVECLAAVIYKANEQPVTFLYMYNPGYLCK